MTTLRTDGHGRASVPLRPETEVMLDAVLIEPADPKEGVDWITHWANLTFALP